MFALLILPILFAGFYVCNHHPEHFYKLHRYEGQYLYLKVATLGFKCFAFSSIFCFLLNKILPTQLMCLPIDMVKHISWFVAEEMTPNSEQNTKFSWVLILTVSTITWAILWCLIAGLRFKWMKEGAGKIYLMQSVLRDNPLDKILLDSYLKENLLMVTLSDRKVYVGTIISLGEPTETSGIGETLELLPVMSGYRDKDNLTVEFTTDYDLTDTELSLVIKQESIVQVTEFDFSAYEDINRGARKADIRYF